MLYVYPHEEISPTERDTRTREQAKNTFLQNSQPGVFDNPRNFPPQAPREKFLVNLEIGFFPTKQTKHGALPMFFLLIFVVLRLWHGAWVCWSFVVDEVVRWCVAEMQADKGAVTIRTRKFLTNRLLSRKQMVRSFGVVWYFESVLWERSGEVWANCPALIAVFVSRRPLRRLPQPARASSVQCLSPADLATTWHLPLGPTCLVF
jgi:hypothetical protein